MRCIVDRWRAVAVCRHGGEQEVAKISDAIRAYRDQLGAWVFALELGLFDN
jgi:hypothetical protein